MALTETEITLLEAQVPELARRAVSEAYARAVASGHPVTIAVGEELIEISADGKRRVVGKVLPPIQAKLTVFSLGVSVE